MNERGNNQHNVHSDDAPHNLEHKSAIPAQLILQIKLPNRREEESRDGPNLEEWNFVERDAANHVL